MKMMYNVLEETVKSDIVNVNSEISYILLKTQFGKLRWIKRRIPYEESSDLILQQQVTKIYDNGKVEEKYIDVIIEKE